MAKATLVCTGIRARSYINVKDTLVEWVHEYSSKVHSAALYAQHEPAKFHLPSGQKTFLSHDSRHSFVSLPDITSPSDQEQNCICLMVNYLQVNATGTKMCATLLLANTWRN